MGFVRVRAGGHRVKKKGVDQPDARASLERIAQTLDKPLSSFFTSSEHESRHAETLAIVRAFDRIKNPQVRARCLLYVTAEADRS